MIAAPCERKKDRPNTLGYPKRIADVLHPNPPHEVFGRGRCQYPTTGDYSAGELTLFAPGLTR